MKNHLVLLIAAALASAPAAAVTPPSFSIDNATAGENSGTIVFRVRKHGHLNGQPSIINLYGVDGSAKFGSDFDSVNQSVTFAAAETVKMVAIHLVNDNIPEPTETFTAKIRAVSNARLYDGTAVATITDSDVAAPPPPPAGINWVAARLLPFNYGRVVSLTNCPLLVGVASSCGSHYPVGARRIPEVGEIVALYTNGWAWSAPVDGAPSGGPMWTAYSLSHGDTITVFSADMTGIAPALGSAEPALPAGWYGGVTKTATKNCGPYYGPEYGGGVTAGTSYRMTFPAAGGEIFPGNPEAFVSAVPAVNPHFGAFAGVKADCFM
jgi:hypothetical protein